MSRWLVLLACGVMASALALTAAPESAVAQPSVPFGASLTEGDPNLPFLMEADSVQYDEGADTITGVGNVQITREGRVLTADEVTYRRADQILGAKGNVVLVEPTGEVLFAEEVELTEKLDQGYAVAPRILMPDGSRLAARGAKRLSKERFEVYRGVYSPCKISVICGIEAPLWQLRAEKIAHSDRRREIEFTDPTLDIFGVPVGWVPYFSMPDPRVKRKTGFLVPTFGSDDDLGFLARVPFFWNISPNQDLTLTPIVTSREYPVGLVEFRHLFPWGTTTLETSFGMIERREDDEVIGTSPRGHIKWTGEASIDDHWRAGFQVYRSSDDTYLRRFKIDTSGVLRSFATAEGFYESAYINATAFSVQEQRVNFSENDTPEAFPFVTAEYDAPLSDTGLNLTAKFGTHTLFRTNGADSHHTVAEAGLGREWNFGGHLIGANVSLRGDLYYTRDVSGADEDEVFGARFQPRATVDWAYPVFRPIGENAVLTLTPRVMATATVGSLNSTDLPNEDSQSVEFDATALFRPRIAAGRDRFDDGQRIDFGLEAALDVEGGRLTGIVGQSYRINSSRDFGTGTGLDRSFSDIVVGVGAQYSDWLDGATRVRWNTSNGSISAAETRLSLGNRPLQLLLTHTMLDARTADGSTLGATHQVDATLRAQINDNWAAFGRHQRDLDEGRALRTEIGLSYADECFRFETVFTRDRLENAEVKDSDSIIFRIALRHLGAASSSQSFDRE